MAFTKRRITLTITLGADQATKDGTLATFDASGSDTVTLEGLRVSASIALPGGVSMSRADLRVYGMPLEVMNKLTILGAPTAWVGARNTVTIEAGDDDAGMAVCFVGAINEAWVDASSPPDVSFIISAVTGLVDQMRPVTPTSFKGSVDVATMLSGIAGKMFPPLALQNDGVQVVLRDPYYPGTYMQQIQEICRAASCNYIVENNQRLAIWPKDGKRGGLVPKLSKDSGMVGYPMHTQQGIQITTLFNPTITYGGEIEVESTLTPAAGAWIVFSMTHEIESETPGGQWFTQMDCNLFGKPTAIGR